MFESVKKMENQEVVCMMNHISMILFFTKNLLHSPPIKSIQLSSTILRTLISQASMEAQQETTPSSHSTRENATTTKFKL